jgi:hypothetical protein
VIFQNSVPYLYLNSRGIKIRATKDACMHETKTERKGLIAALTYAKR